MNDRKVVRYWAGRMLKRYERPVLLAIILTLTIAMLCMMQGCTTGDYIMGPTPNELHQAQTQVLELPAGSPEQIEAAAKLKRLRETMDAAKLRREAVTSTLSTYLPGGGAVLALIFAAWRRARENEKQSLLVSTFSAIEDTKNSDGESAVDVLLNKVGLSSSLEDVKKLCAEFKAAGGYSTTEFLVSKLAEHHDRNGVRLAAKKQIAELKAPNKKA